MQAEAKKARKMALVEGIIAGVLFGTAAVLIRLLSGFSVFSIALWRLIIASVFVALLLVVLRKPFAQELFRRNLPRILILGILLGSHFILFVSAVMDTSILNATVLVNTTCIWSMFVSSFVFKLKPSRLAVVGIFTSFVGVSLIAFGDVSSQGLALSLKGDVEAVLAAVVESLYLSYGRETRRKLPILHVMLAIYLFSTLPVLVWGFASRSPLAFPTDLGLVAALVALGLLPTALAHTFYFSSLSSLKSFETASMALLEPVGATLLGIAILGQVPAPIFVLGAVLVLGGIFSVAMSE